MNKDIFEMIPSPIVITDLKGSVIHMNRAGKQMFNIKGRTKKRVYSFFEGRQRDAFKEQLNKLIEKNRRQSFECVCKTGSTRQRHLYWHISFLKGSSKKRIICVGTDITEHGRMDKEKEAKREHLQQCLDENMNKVKDINRALRQEIRERHAYENEMKEKIRFNKLINSITNRFVNMDPENVRDGSIGILRKIAKFGQFDMAGLIGRSFARDAMIWQVHWANRDFNYERIIEMNKLRTVEKELLKNGIINIPEFPQAEGSMRRELSIIAGNQIGSILMTPLFYRKKLVALLVFLNFESTHTLTDNLKEELLFITKMLINFIDNKVVNRELLRSQKKYRIVTKQTGHVVYDYDIKWKRTEWSGAIREVTGYSKGTFGEFYNKHFDQFIHPDDIERVRDDIDNVLKTTGKYRFQYRIKHKKGKFRHILDEGTVTSDQSGRPLHMIGTMKDITERIEYENELKRNEERYRNFVKNSNEGIWRILFKKPLKLKYSHAKQFSIYMKYAYIDECNDVCARMYGYEKAEDLVGTMLSDIMRRDNLTPPKRWEFAEKEYRASNFTSREYDRYGNEKYFLNNTVGIIRDGEVKSVWGTQQDITEKIIAERDLKENQRQMEVLMSNLPGMVYRRKLDEQLSMEFASDGVYYITGFSADEIINQYEYFDLIHERDKPGVVENIVEAIGLDKQYKFSYRIFDRDGNRRWVWEQGRPVSDADGDPVAIEGFITDITEQKVAELTAQMQQKQLMQADKMATLGILVSGVAHEINNPNNFIMLNAKIIDKVWSDIGSILDDYYRNRGDFLIAGLKYSEARGKMPKLINGIIEGTDRIKAIVSNLKDFSKTDAGMVSNKMDVNIAIESAVMIVRNLIKKKTDHFHVKLYDSLPLIKANKQQIEQVIINLLTNACDALPDRGKAISIESGIDSDRIFVRVSDEGIGVSEEYRKHIFDPFFTTKRDEGGTGLGLSISYNIVKDHGGDIEFESQQDRGTVVTIFLPANEEE